MPPETDLRKCTSCGLCDELCPLDIIHMDKEKNIPVVVYPNECSHCGICKMNCEPEAIIITLPLSILV